MTRYDLLKMNESVIKVFLDNKIDPRDVVRLRLFEDYTDMRNRGERYEYTIAYLCEKYQCCEATVMNVVKRMCTAIKL